MKKYISTLAYITLATGIQGQEFAIDPLFNGKYKVAEINVTFALTKSTESAALDSKDEYGKVITPAEKVYFNDFYDSRGHVYEYGTQITKAKYGNAELLRDMVALGVVESAAGWSIVCLYDNTYFSYEETEPVSGVYGVYLKKKQGTGFVLKDITEYLSFESYSETPGFRGYVDAYNYLESNNYETNVYSYAETGSTFGLGEVKLSDIYLSGEATVGYTWDAGNQIYRITPTIKGLIGAVGSEDESSDIVWDGSASGSVVTIGDLATYQSAIAAGYYQ